LDLINQKGCLAARGYVAPTGKAYSAMAVRLMLS
jgi:hypothetical protein